jgi:type IV secretory pathway TraG/TraD family ATPase VirD4
MYLLARLFTIIACLAMWIAVGELIVLTWPISVLFVLGIVVRRKAKRKPLTTLGSARWANKQDLQAAGMLDADRGLILGHLA